MNTTRPATRAGHDADNGKSSATHLRRLGYPVRVPRQAAIARLLGRAGYRLTPMYRAEPGSGHWYTTCPLCDVWYGLVVESDWQTATFTCRCVVGDVGAEELSLILAGGAA